MSEETKVPEYWAPYALILCLLLAFCGEPDLHDSFIKYADSLSGCEVAR